MVDRGVRNAAVIAVGNGIVKLSSNLKRISSTFSSSLCPEKGMNPYLLPSTMGK